MNKMYSCLGSKTKYCRRLALSASIAAIVASNSVMAEDESESKSENDISEEVVVKGFRGSLQASRNIKRNASGIVDAIVATDIGKFPDSNLGEALQRLPGITLERNNEQEGAAYSVRGLGPDFTKTIVNGMSTTSTGIVTGVGGGGTGARGLDVQLFSADLFQAAKVYKTYSSDLIEGGLAGTVALETAKPLELREKTVTTTIKGIDNSRSEETDLNASVLLSDQFFDGKLGILLAGSYSERTSRTDEVNNSRGNLLSRFPSISEDDPRANVLVPQLPRNLIFSQQNERTGFGAVVQFHPSEDLKIDTNYLYAELDRDFQRHSIGAWLRGNFLSDDAQDVVDPVISDGALVSGTFNNTVVWTDDTRLDRDIDFQHLTTNVEWNLNDSWVFSGLAGYSNSGVTTPINGSPFAARVANVFVSLENDNLPFFIARDPVTNDVIDFTDPTDFVFQRQRNQSSQSDDSLFTVKFDFEHRFENGGFKFGASFEDKELEFRRFQDQFNLADFEAAGIDTSIDDVIVTLSESVPGGVFLEGESLPDGFFSRDHFVLDFDRVNEEFERVNPNPGAFPTLLTSNSYDVGEEVLGLFVKADIDVEVGGLPFRADFGLRYVDTNQSSTSEEGGLQITRERSYKDWLPAINARLDISEELIARASFARVLNRPTIALLPSSLQVGRDGVSASGGNPDLDPFRADRFDAGVEWYFDGGLVAVTGFVYNVQSFIQSVTEEEFIPELVGAAGVAGEGDGIFDVTRPRNGEGARVQGLEFVLDLPFDNFVPIPGFGTVFNYTTLSSQADNLTGSGFNAPLPGFSDETINGVLYYEYGSLSARIAYTRRSEYVNEIANGGAAFMDPYKQIDFAARYDINDTLQVTFDVLNLTEENRTGTFRFGPDAVEIDNGNQFFERRVAVGLRASF
ncbi:TonB-dependent receptor [Porticoccus sp. GXU_MW_L64]